MNQEVKQKGFTIIELLLAMSFISMLLLAIAMTILQIGRIYNRGVTISEVNEAAQSIAIDIERSITAAGTLDLEGDSFEPTTDGRLCLGQYSYIMNYGKFQQDFSNVNRYANADADTPITLIKIEDPGKTYCGGATTSTAHAGTIEKAASTDLLAVGDHNLALHNFSITRAAGARDERTGQSLYHVSFTIGTNDQAALDDTQSSCKPPNIAGSDLAYCYVQQFTIVVRAGSEVN